MKGNDGTGNTVERDEWQTPQALWDELNKQYHFNFDCCSNGHNSKCIWFSTDLEKQNDLFGYMCWMNPPFSKAKQMFNLFFKKCVHGVAIYRCDNMETSVWQDIILPNATWIAIPKGRIKYEGFEGNSSRFPSALIGFNVEEPKAKIFKVLKQ